MQSALVAADPVSPLNCVYCAKALGSDLVGRQICPHCGLPAPVAVGEDYFSVLGTEPRFAQDLGALEKSYYLLSRALHPDRFTGAPASARDASLARMSLLNDAYQTLKHPEELRSYYLKQAGITSDRLEGSSKSQVSPQIPMELAESWFELQDVLSEDPTRAREKLEEFETELGRLRSAKQVELRALEAAIDADPNSPSRLEKLQGLAKAAQSQSYLFSLGRDVDRMKKRFLSSAS